MKIPFTKAHGDMNDFLLTWEADAGAGDLPAAARAICARHTGVGADGWLIVTPSAGEVNGRIVLYNSDGSLAEMSGNGTRCAAAFLIEAGLAADVIRIGTGAGVKELRLVERQRRTYLLEMNMGKPVCAPGDDRARLELSSGPKEAVVLDVGNPQCALFVDDFDFDWQALGREIESFSLFPNRTNVSFVRVVDRHTIDVRFYERGAGVTMSSGTGSTGAAYASLLRGYVDSPVRVDTPAGGLDIVERRGALLLTGPAQIVAAGEYFCSFGS